MGRRPQQEHRFGVLAEHLGRDDGDRAGPRTARRRASWASADSSPAPAASGRSAPAPAPARVGSKRRSALSAPKGRTAPAGTRTTSLVSSETAAVQRVAVPVPPVPDATVRLSGATAGSSAVASSGAGAGTTCSA